MYKEINDYELIYMIREHSIDEDILYRKYAGLIDKILKKYRLAIKKYGIDIDDLRLEAQFGLWFAIKNYTEDNNSIFYTYASICIESKIMNYLKKCSSNRNKLFSDCLSLQEQNDVGIAREEYISISKDMCDELVYEELINIIKETIKKTTNDKANIIVLKLKGYKNKEISDMLSIPLSKINYLWASIRQELKNSLLLYNENKI